jgi:hypothetical protein
VNFTDNAVIGAGSAFSAAIGAGLSVKWVLANHCGWAGIVSLDGNAAEFELNGLHLVRTRVEGDLAQICFFGDFRLQKCYFLGFEGELAVGALGVLICDGCFFDRRPPYSPYVFFTACDFGGRWPRSFLPVEFPDAPAEMVCPFADQGRRTPVIPGKVTPVRTLGLFDFPTPAIITTVAVGLFIAIAVMIGCFVSFVRKWRASVIRLMHAQYADRAAEVPPPGRPESGQGTITMDGEEIPYEIDPGLLAVWDTDDEFGAIAGGLAEGSEEKTKKKPKAAKHKPDAGKKKAHVHREGRD